VLCGGSSFRPVFSPPSAPGRALERCRSCSLLQMVPMPTAEELFRYYQSYDVVGEAGDYYAESWGPDALETPEGADVRDRADWMLRLLPRPRRVLDVGSGPGHFLRVMKERGIPAEGAELSGPAAERSAREHGLIVQPGTIADAPRGPFAAITLWDVVEHVRDPAAMIREAAARLERGGWLFLETPDEAALLDRATIALARAGWRGPADVFYGMHHVVLFRRATIERLLGDNGFEVRAFRGAETYIGRAFRGRTLRDRVMRTGLRAVFLLGRVLSRPNKMLVAAQKAPAA
jgi:2-polyprenyl-3-methyl-5-hydroxy-6-metoxy-1,4-benzoquinol methylase